MRSVADGAHMAKSGVDAAVEMLFIGFALACLARLPPCR